MDEVRRALRHLTNVLFAARRTTFRYQRFCTSRSPLLFLLLVCFAASISAQPFEKTKIRKRLIEGVKFEGNKSLSNSDLSSVVQAKTASFIDKFLNELNSNWGFPKQYVETAILEHDTVAIFLLYQNIGYLDAKITYKIVVDSSTLARSSDEISVTVVYVIKENTPYKVAGFTFDGLENLPEDLQKEATENIGIKTNSIYSRVAIAREYQRIQLLLEEHGYPFFSRDQVDVARDTSKFKVVITIPFKTGNRYKFGETSIKYDSGSYKGNRVSESTVRRQLLFSKDDWFSSSKLALSERNINNLSTFESVRIGLDTSDVSLLADSARNGKSLPVSVLLKMRSTQDISPGFRIGIGTSGTTFAAKLGYSNRNVFGGAESFTAEGSYQFLPALQLVYDIGGRFAIPYFGFRNFSPLGLGVSVSRFQLFENVKTDTAAGSSATVKLEKFHIQKVSVPLTTSYDISQGSTPTMTFAPGLTFEYVESYFDTSYSKEKRDKAGKPQFNSILSGDFVIDGTNNPLNPSKGGSLRYSLEWGLPIIKTSLPSASYIRNTLQARQYFDLTGHGSSVIAMRAYAGTAIRRSPNEPLRDVPTTRLYLGGGPTSLRGWASRSLLVSSSDEADPNIGGFTRLEANIEYRFSPFKQDLENSSLESITSPITFALFCDAGNVWDKDTKVSLSDAAIAIGIGLRYNTIVGPIRLDFGFRLYDPTPDPEQDKSIYDHPKPMKPGAVGRWLFDRKDIHNTFNFEFTIGDPFQ